MSKRSSRRDFFKKVTSTIATGGVVMAAGRGMADSTIADDQQENTTEIKGYQKSEHVKAYYRRVNF